MRLGQRRDLCALVTIVHDSTSSNLLMRALFVLDTSAEVADSQLLIPAFQRSTSPSSSAAATAVMTGAGIGDDNRITQG